MGNSISRRQVVRLAPLGVGALWLAPSVAVARSERAEATLPHFPHTDPDLARKVVGLSHSKLDELRPVVEERPALANAAIDWGFGDWETAIGAASHVGRPDIARFLMSHGARPDIFTFAMLGNLDAVRGIIEANPGAQRLYGPHGFTLMHHARVGGDGAKAVVAYLESVGDADLKARDEPITDEQKKAIMGEYAFGPAAADRLILGEGMGGLTIKRGADGIPRRLSHQGDLLFHPAGAPSVRIQFTIRPQMTTQVRVTDGLIVIEGESC